MQHTIAPRALGFTLIELIIAVAIIGILAAIAWPNYQQHVQRSRRADATSALLDAANRQEQFILNRGRYANNLADLGIQAATPDGFYRIGISAPTAACPIASCYELAAVPAAGSPQANDARCQLFVLRSNGTREARNNDNQVTTNDCW